MKKTFRFMVMAIAAIVMAGTTVACDPMNKDEEKQEQTGDNTENEGTENEGEAPAAITLDGKQWVTVLADGSAYCFDFGVNTAGKYIECYISLDKSSPAYYKFTDTTPGDYLIEPETETTGKLTVVNPMWGPAEYLYKDLTATSVMIQDPIYGLSDYIPFTVAEQLIVPQGESQE
jgi:hypothetical protein